MQPTFGVQADISFRKFPNSGGISTPPPMKFGTRIPNRVFIGGIPPMTTEADVHSCFSKYGNVRAVKLIMDKSGVPKGYGFVTFETEEEANLVLKAVELEGGSLPFKDRKLNIGEAVRKMPFFSEDQSRLPNRGGSVIPDVALMPPMQAVNEFSMYNYYLQPYPLMDPGNGGYGPGPLTWPPGADPAYQQPWATYQTQHGLPHPAVGPPYPQMLAYQQQAPLLGDALQPSDVSSWSSAGSCASSTCSTASFGNAGDLPFGTVAEFSSSARGGDSASDHHHQQQQHQHHHHQHQMPGGAAAAEATTTTTAAAELFSSGWCPDGSPGYLFPSSHEEAGAAAGLTSALNADGVEETYPSMLYQPPLYPPPPPPSSTSAASAVIRRSLFPELSHNSNSTLKFPLPGSKPAEDGVVGSGVSGGVEDNAATESHEGLQALLENLSVSSSSS
ncbi:unnamed protein product [Notodromas monacha]|uniref:RRM domain-containing protein n=1 Tax=Notodromas monacha TaxID=399045 RepID=A0A7R9BNS6_9CRUS|nr:unnamed protein product [Notodromas monacha]CAG0917394.1 unnamed protein product [Notodromas monacha]